MYALYVHPKYFKFKQKYQQYSLLFQTIFPYLSTMLYKIYKKKKQKKIVIQKSDKGNSVVTVDKADYLDKLKNLLNGTCKYEKKI